MTAASQQLQQPADGSGVKQRVHIRWMIRRDMPEVLAIEGESFEFPWEEENFIRALRQRNCIGMVAEDASSGSEYGRIVAYMIYELHKTRLHLLSLAVASDCHRRGIGRQMIDKIKAKLSAERRTRICLEVRETNLAAQLFFKSLGFRAVSIMKDYYDDTPEDGYLFQYRFRSTAPEAVQVDPAEASCFH